MPGLVRFHNWIDAQGMEFINRPRRVVAGVGGQLFGDRACVGYGLLHHGYALLLVRRLVGGPGRHYDLVSIVRHRLAVVGQLEVPSSRARHDAGLGVGEVALGLVIGHPRMVSALRLSLRRSIPGLGLQRRLWPPLSP